MFSAQLQARSRAGNKLQVHPHPKQTTTGLELGGAGSKASWAAALTTGRCLYSAWHACSLHHGSFLCTAGSRRQIRLQNGATLRIFSPRMLTSHQLGAQRSVSTGLAQFPTASLTALQSWAASPFTCEQQAWGFCKLFRSLLSTS